jgi:hypothetical protein
MLRYLWSHKVIATRSLTVKAASTLSFWYPDVFGNLLSSPMHLQSFGFVTLLQPETEHLTKYLPENQQCNSVEATPDIPP